MDRQELNRWLAERNLKGHWDHQPWSQVVRSHLWKWSDIYEGLNWSGKLITTDEAGRRTIQLRNPGLPAGMTNTIHFSVQLVNPGEIAAAHRHTAGAIRFILKGNPQAYTVVEGERLPMSEGDLLTTPNWTWHDHFNGGDEPVVWLDGLDIRLVGTFGAMIQENLKKSQQPIEKPESYSSKVFGQARPTWIKSEFVAPPYRSLPLDGDLRKSHGAEGTRGRSLRRRFPRICQPFDRRSDAPDFFLPNSIAPPAGEDPFAPPYQHDGL